MRLFFLIASLLLIGCNKDSVKFLESTDQRLHSWIKDISSDEFQGREPGTLGAQLAKNYIAQQLSNLNLTPLSGDSFFLKVPTSKITLKEQSYATITFRNQDRRLETGKEIVFWTKHAAEYKKIRDSELVFVGYGIVAPEYNWNDYKGLDVRGKTVVILINDPGFETGNLRLFNGKSMTYYGRWTYKFEEAARQGAAAAIILHEEEPAAYPWTVVQNSWQGPQLDLLREDLGASRATLEGWIPHDVFDGIIQYTGFNYSSLKDIALSETFQPFTLRGLSLSTEIYNEVEYISSHNLAAVQKGAKYPDEYILFTAHWDHLGILEGDSADDLIMNGAVDNATGVSSVLEFAYRFSQKPPERSIIYLFVTLEESGLLGSEYFAAYPPVPLNHIVAGFNFDGIQPTGKTNDMVVIGYGASELEDLLEEELLKQGRYVNPDPNPEKGYFYRSDHISFAKRGVPMLYADSGSDLENGGRLAGLKMEEEYRLNYYHAVGDEYDPSWNLEGLTQSIDTVYAISSELANSQAWPNWYEGNEFRAIRDSSRTQ
ncbi:MAG: M28 family peptidase [Gammaproteobacteria bacterium]